jgi:hypothetical protein
VVDAADRIYHRDDEVDLTEWRARAAEEALAALKQVFPTLETALAQAERMTALYAARERLRGVSEDAQRVVGERYIKAYAAYSEALTKMDAGYVDGRQVLKLARDLLREQAEAVLAG